ncbi:MerR family transcriptional regulator [Corynebacterium kutscheri]|uniref:MerR family regulatory protein n=1 Tax=Corynebacterium kutscheri TaxID=35755 RepID=A0A0F6R096_9CORY|nr:MerR family transcriptional regulator [Corynebacterium kutscheri]AKE41170.1 MerR family regulatory protein [Corynebacterium kutscheri]VEH08446.1 MerR family transcriptional regulator [Corynebacterium kutscheri]VEH09492.1 MerR family transcriptional regulator [Corynebacterium kutscheri]
MNATAHQSTASAQQSTKRAKKTVSIGVVIETLTKEFPDVTVSKIRFLESEGLITPQRTSSGYRRFTADDVDRLRFILTTQRDNYLPLKVIREQLEAMDSGAVTQLKKTTGDQLIGPESFAAPTLTRLTDSDLAERAEVSIQLVTELIEAHVVVPDSSGFFTNDDVSIVSVAEQLKGFGFDTRHLKSLRNTAARQADLIQRAATPVARLSADGKERADDMKQQMTALVVSMHATLVKSVLRGNHS